ncbi:MAG: type II toxin-antitoxin system mRNA interferase toxin, RelE/StbE family [Prevotellaceae bacterium]|jgi:addiction module RelE/StbE family toxin|nr:type II toxin-antitoxin system mRNA interferase toxin, RelE/StbE family [Prevotellaceae bacterium]
MRIDYHKNALKQFRRLKRVEQIRLFEILKLLENEPLAEQLRNHQLKGKLSKFRSVSVGGGIRLYYYEKEQNHLIIAFVATGYHAQVH